jgi:protein ImuB
MRLACLFVPLFPLAARLRSEPELKGDAVVIFEGNGNAARVVAASRRARKAGIEAGMTLPQSRALLPKLAARGRDRECERAAQEALLEVAESFSPRVEDGREGVAYLDLEGLPVRMRGKSSQLSALSFQQDRSDSRPSAIDSQPNHKSQMTVSAGGRLATGAENFLARGETRALTLNSQFSTLNSSHSSEISLGRDLIAAAEKAGLPARAGIAASKLAARLAAGLPESPTVVPSGEEASFLAPLPLGKLAPALEIAEALERWGLKSIGELAKLPEGEVASRLGEMGRELHATARGVDPRPLEPRPEPLHFSEGLELDWPLASLEPFLFVGHAALERLMRRLESQALACTRVEVALKLDPDGHDTRAIALPAPTRDTKTLLTLVRLELEARPPGAPVVGFVFTAHPDRPRSVELSLFGPAALSPDRLATTIARLASILGADRVGSPRTMEGYRPERFTLTDYSPPPPPRFAIPRRTGRGLLAVRVLRPPVGLEVIVASSCHPERSEGSAPVSSNLECQISTLNSPRPFSLKSLNGSSPSISGAVRIASGPWSLEEGWWLSAPDSQAGASADPEQAKAACDRDYWDVELSDGALYRIYRDRRNGAWFADGVYD